MLIYDCEIKKGILKNGETPLPGVEYCGGWDDYDSMGISCVCTYDTYTTATRVFLDDNKDDLLRLFDAHDCIIGFNNRKFDDKLIEATYGYAIHHDKSYDLLVEIWAGVGLGPVYEYGTHNGFGLDAVAKANGMPAGKSGNGALAPVWYQRGEYGRLIDYCLQDVRITAKLIDKVLLTGTLLNPKKTGGPVIPVQRPFGRSLF